MLTLQLVIRDADEDAGRRREPPLARLGARNSCDRLDQQHGSPTKHMNPPNFIQVLACRTWLRLPLALANT